MRIKLFKEQVITYSRRLGGLDISLLPVVFLSVAIDLALIAYFWGQSIFLIDL